MSLRNILYVSLLFLSKERAKNFITLLIVSMIFFTHSTLSFLASSIKNELTLAALSQDDITLQKLRGGSVGKIPCSLADKIEKIQGVKLIEPRIWGIYYFENIASNFTVIGYERFLENGETRINALLQNLDNKTALKEGALVGKGVYEAIKRYTGKEAIPFIKGSNVTNIPIAGIFSAESSMYTNDLVLLPMEQARAILDFKRNECSDIGIAVYNNDEIGNIKRKLLELDSDLLVTLKEDIILNTASFFDRTKGTQALIYILLFLSLALLVFDRYSSASGAESRDYGLLKALGYHTDHLLAIEALKSTIVLLSAFIIGTFLAYLFVFALDAPIFRDIFLGYSRLNEKITFVPAIDFLDVFGGFIALSVLFMCASLIPIWRKSTKEDTRGMR